MKPESTIDPSIVPGGSSLGDDEDVEDVLKKPHFMTESGLLNLIELVRSPSWNNLLVSVLGVRTEADSEVDFS